MTSTSSSSPSSASQQQQQQHYYDHLVLMGDSVLDNRTYVPEHLLSVEEQFRAHFYHTTKVTRLARDGATMEGVRVFQLEHPLPSDTTHVLLSVGGNDGLVAFSSLQRNSNNSWWSVATTFFQKFAADYDALLELIQTLYPKVTLMVCTIYQPWTDKWLFGAVSNVGVRLMNRAIRECAKRRKLPVMDLWAIFTEKADFANVIEPGVPGGDKMVLNFRTFVEDRACGEVRDTYDRVQHLPHFKVAENTCFDATRFSGMTNK